MKLRNKKTGEITQDDDWDFVGLVLKFDHKNDTYEMDDKIEYHSLAELNADWEDYEGKEPIIKDPKVRKAVQKWAEANNVKVVYIAGLGKLSDERRGISIEFNSQPFFGWVSARKTITELCEEDEE